MERTMIAGSTTVDVALQAPAAEQAFRRRGMHCPVCPISKFMTVDEACRIYRVDPAELLDELNEMPNGRA
jgi:hybrid cluster-associated redox disulfide protein